MKSHQLPKEREPIHFGHFEIEDHAVRIEREDFLSCIEGISSGRDTLDALVAHELVAQNLAYHGAVVNNDDSYVGHRQFLEQSQALGSDDMDFESFAFGVEDATLHEVFARRS